MTPFSIPLTVWHAIDSDYSQRVLKSFRNAAICQNLCDGGDSVEVWVNIPDAGTPTDANGDDLFFEEPIQKIQLDLPPRSAEKFARDLLRWLAKYAEKGGPRHNERRNSRPSVTLVTNEQFDKARAIHAIGELLPRLDVDALWSIVDALKDSLKYDCPPAQKIC